jgi:phosphoribosylglycinamide formyltransferase-1
MVKFPGNSKINLAIFISGRGTNFKSIFNFSKKKKSILNIKLVISDNKYAKGLEFSKKKKISTKVIKFVKKRDAENKILKLIKSNKIDLICLAGFMKILSEYFLEKCNPKILNIHPSLLPKYKGLNTHMRVLKNKDKFSGCTVHLVNKKLDAGKIILQKKVKVNKNDTIKSLEKKILKIENKIYPLAIMKTVKSIF